MIGATIQILTGDSDPFKYYFLSKQTTAWSFTACNLKAMFFIIVNDKVHTLLCRHS